MLRGLTRRESNFFGGEIRGDPSAATAAAAGSAGGPALATQSAGVPGAKDPSGVDAPSAESGDAASSRIPDGQNWPATTDRYRQIEEVVHSVSKELSAVQMSEEGGIRAWSAAAPPDAITGRELGESAGGANGRPPSDQETFSVVDPAEFGAQPLSPTKGSASLNALSIPVIDGGETLADSAEDAAGNGSAHREGKCHPAEDTDNIADDTPAATPVKQVEPHERVSMPATMPDKRSLHQQTTATATPTSSHVAKENSVVSTSATGMTKEQLRYCASVIKSLKRHNSAHPFLKPVDPVALGIPDYFKVVKTPMDLRTVEEKLAKGQYMHSSAFADDMRLIFSNCYLYNGRQSVYSQMASQLETIFENQMKKIPGASPLIQSAPGPTRPKPATAPLLAVTTPQHPPARKVSVTPKSAVRKPVTPARKLSAKSSPAAQTDRRMRFCVAVLNELCKKQHAEFNTPFLQPVDPVALNIPEYPSIIRNPMDLSTIRRKLDAGKYPSPREFEADVNLMFDNCSTFNRPGEPVYACGERLRELFREKWKDLPPLPARKKEKVAPKPSTPVGGGGGKKTTKGCSSSRRKSAPAPKEKERSDEKVSEESESDEGEPVLGNFEQLALMEAHMNMMQKRLEELKNAAAAVKSSRKKLRAESGPTAGKSRKGSKSKASSSSSASKKPNAEAGGASSSRRKSAASAEADWGELAAVTATAKGKRNSKKRRASEVEFTSSGGEEEDGRAGRGEPASSAMNDGGGSSAKPPAKKAKSQQAAAVGAAAVGPPTIQFEHKQQLSEMINSLGEDKLEVVIEIIHDSMPHLRGATEEVELDLDVLDYGSFYKLYNYVVHNMRPSRKGGGGAAAGKGDAPSGKSKGARFDTPRPGADKGATAAVAAPRPAAGSNTPYETSGSSGVSDAPAASGGVTDPADFEKKKIMPEEEQHQQILVLEEKLKSFAGVAGPNGSPEGRQVRGEPFPPSDSSLDSAVSGDEDSECSLA